MATRFSKSDAFFVLSSSSYRRFSLTEIRDATNNFDVDKISRSDSFYTEYVATVPSNDVSSKTKTTLVSVINFYDNVSKFNNEVLTVTKIKVHPNIISPIGYCIESRNRILVYEYMENHSLKDYLKMDSGIVLSWKKRLTICLGVAYGLRHLHKPMSGFHEGIVLGHVRSADILLDENWDAKISNFAMSEFISTAGTFFGTPQDVYCFGSLLFEVLCRKEMRNLGRRDEDTDFGVLAQENVDIGIKEGLSPDSLRVFTDAIRKCLQSDKLKRPSMDAVVMDLEAALKFQIDADGEPILKVDLINISPRESMNMEGVTELDLLNESDEVTNKSKQIMSSSSSASFKWSSSCSSSSSSSFESVSLCHQFPFDEIKKATNNFDLSKCLGKGGEGTVYHAEIYLGSKTEKSMVAVKHLDKGFTSEFEKEIMTVAKFRHPNIVSLLGYCKGSDEKVLIYEYMGKGSLSDYVKMNSKVCLSWKQRLNLCLGAAKGLQHLHRETLEFPKGIIHRDVKPENILIDDNWVAKISDFGMLKLSNASQTQSTFLTVHAKGTPGYFAPETLSYSRKLSKKVDVYAFGFVMFEVLCRKKRWAVVEDESVYIEDDDDIGLLAKQNIDSKIKDQISDSSQRVFTAIIAECMQFDPKRRPTMDKVVLKLEALKCQENTTE